ncbi:MAG TPA: TonB family protein [Candidatus Paceibacterota bacterium]
MAIAVLFEIALVVVLIFSPLFFKIENKKDIVSVGQLFLSPSVPRGPGSVEKKTGSLTPKKKPEIQKNEAPKKEVLQSPTEIPKEIVKGENDEKKTDPEKEITESGENTGGVLGGKPCDSPNCVVGGTGEEKNKKENADTKENDKKEETPPPENKPKTGGNIKQAVLIYKVKPIYPELARKRGIQGNVFLEAIVNVDGNLRDIKIISGHYLFHQPSIDALEQWKYEPAILNGEPVEVTTTITVRFMLEN